MANESGAIQEFQGGQKDRQLAVIEERSSRQVAEVQAAMTVAKRFPRDQAAAYSRIMTACDRRTLAEQAIYSYPRGGASVTGPSIRLAEALAQAWGNLEFGVAEVEQRSGESTMMAFCWDLETNTRQTAVFQAKHVRDTRKGRVVLQDSRDIYEMTANLGARRVRKCILGIIPGDVVDAAVARCEKTLRNAGGDEPLVDRVRKMIAAFAAIGVTQPQIEARLGHYSASISEQELVGLRKIYSSIKDGMAGAQEYFHAELPDKEPTISMADVAPPSKAPAKKRRAKAAPVQETIDGDTGEVMTSATHPVETEYTGASDAWPDREPGEEG